jgi:Ca-activated chloride channel homolog
MSFQSPWLLVSLLVLVAAYGIWKLAERRRMRYAVRYPNVDVLATVVPERSRLRLVGPLLFALALALLLAGLARPHVERTFLKERATVILVVDTSRSMQAQDAIRTFLDNVPGDLNVGLVVFAGEAQVATPPTKDHELVEEAVNEIDGFLIFGGTAIGDALETAVELGKQATDERVPGQEIADEVDLGPTRHFAQAVGCGDESPASILFLSDGAQTRGILQPFEGAALAQEACIPVFTIALGTPEGTIDRGAFGSPFGTDPGAGNDIPVPPDPETLRQIAESTGGEFSEARDAGALERAYSKLSSQLGREPGESEITFLFLALAAVLLVVATAFSLLVSPRLP